MFLRLLSIECRALLSRKGAIEINHKQEGQTFMIYAI